MKFGVCLPHRWKYSSSKNIAEMARQAEALGYDSVWVTDHIFVPPSHVERSHTFYEALTTLSYVAALTDKVLLGTAVLALPPREPVLLAKQIATVDALSNGRMVLGAGAGWMEEELRFLGVKKGERGNRLDETIEAMRRLWSTEGPVTFKGKFTHFSNMLFYPKPPQKSGPPIWIGGMKAASLARVARVGDGWFPWAISPDELNRGWREIQRLMQKQKNTRPLTLACFMPTNLQSAGPKGYEGFFGEDHYILSGTEKDVVKALEKFDAAGLDHLALSFRDVRVFKDESADEMFRQVKLFANQVMPSFKG